MARMTERQGNITGFVLKIAAILGMTANHMAHAYSNVFPIWLTLVLYWFGGLTYPIMAFLIVEGYTHTSNLKKYATRLGIFAIISQVPFSLMFGWKANVLFTLLIGLGLLWVWDNVKSIPLKALLFIVGIGLSFGCDWAVQGPLIVFMFYYFRNAGRRGIALTMTLPYAVVFTQVLTVLPAELSAGMDLGAAVATGAATTSLPFIEFAGLPIVINGSALIGFCNLGYALVGFSLSTLLLMLYNGKRGRSMKWFFYVYYPLHLFVIWAIKVLL